MVKDGIGQQNGEAGEHPSVWRRIEQSCAELELALQQCVLGLSLEKRDCIVVQESEEEAQALAVDLLRTLVLSLEHILPLRDMVTVLKQCGDRLARGLPELAAILRCSSHQIEQRGLLEDLLSGLRCELFTRCPVCHGAGQRGWCHDVGSWLDQEGWEDRVPKCVDIERLVVGFEKGLKAGHGVHLDLEIAVLLLLR